MPSKRSPNNAVGGDSTQRAFSLRAWWQLAVVCIIAAAVWLVILPRIARIPAIAAQREMNEARGINPGAMYYTELRAMPRIEAEMRQRIRQQPSTLWSRQR
jgi:hypothetical protein